ncbi:MULTISPECIES: DUF3962 domain-containing protein [Kitasatospora]|uniref:DUF3893 domain-containing protein n=1 Tax=Kitasatospora setae (strain ATCC 33774 / DSM 43861 / JCM 3304 / KCC A-0304 / NBRC 14216 / KM-6054) TaxID=452652 RepID=E4N108_KITSK|nr:DUF3962 domain-containing protein [Kitasatospora setae]BAJ31842.1 hypothetical protein KSE_60760 [Kitasatospora setae KM-6054]
MKYSNVRLAAYQPHPGAAWNAEYHTLVLPRHYREALLALYRRGLKRDPEQCRSLPVGRFNSLLQSLLPGIVSVAKWVDVEDEAPWLYAHGPVPPEVFAAVFTAWVWDLRPDSVPRREVRQLIAGLAPATLRWERGKIPLLAGGANTVGTAQPDPRLYQLLPDAIAQQALQLSPFKHEKGSLSLSFRTVARRSFERGAELVSWPPDLHVDKRGEWFFSAVIGVTLQTVPFHPLPRIHVRTGVRRWATGTGRNGLFLPARRATSVFLKPSAPWLKGTSPQLAGSFSVARMRYDRQAKAVAWEHGGPTGMLSRLTLEGDFPEPADLLSDPARWLRGVSGLEAAVVHSTAMGSHGVMPGLMPRDRVPLTEWFESAFPDAIGRLPDLERVTKHRPAPVNRARSLPADEVGRSEEKARRARQRREGLARLNGGRTIDLDFLWNTSEIRIAMVKGLEELLGLSGPEPEGSDDRLAWHTPELDVRLRLQRISALGGGLPLDKADRRRTVAIRAAIQSRRTETAARLARNASRERPALAVLEILERGSYEISEADPKFALRLGCGDARTLSQFVLPQPPDKNTKRRATALEAKAVETWTDGFRQLGLRAVPEHGFEGDTPEDLQYAAFWLVRRLASGPTREAALVPIAIRIRPQEGYGAPEAITGWDARTGEWVPYAELHLRLAAQAVLPVGEDGEDLPDDDPVEEAGRGEGGSVRDAQREAVSRAVQEMLFSLRDRPTLLLAHAQNSRQLWTWLQNAEIEPDRIGLYGREPQPLGTQGSGLRLVRLRSQTGFETPQWWGHGGDASPKGPEAGEEAPEPANRAGIAEGLWRHPSAGPDDRLFVSAAERGWAGQGAIVNASRWVTREIGKSGVSKVETGRIAWNPGLLELAVVGCQPGDDPELWAALTHQLRRTPDYRSYLALPLPLHLAKLAGEYVLPATAEPEEADDAAPAADGGSEAVQLAFDL